VATRGKATNNLNATLLVTFEQGSIEELDRFDGGSGLENTGVPLILEWWGEDSWICRLDVEVSDCSEGLVVVASMGGVRLAIFLSASRAEDRREGLVTLTAFLRSRNALPPFLLIDRTCSRFEGLPWLWNCQRSRMS